MAARKTSTRKRTSTRKKASSRKTVGNAVRKAAEASKAAKRKRSSAPKAAPKKTATRKASSSTRSVARKTTTTARKASPRRWSADVTEHSDAMDLQDGVFKGRNPHKIALSLKHSAETSHRRKTTPFQSAMSMLNFYINRAGHNLTPARRKVLDAAKDELRDLFGRAD